ncbi:MAG TPA: hypothetical protein VLB11_01145 [Methyloceanibacter sp.]|nr:hypothetical protein [Methyloceanibacter sp.]
MVSPMREKRAWPPRDRDADGETVAAFEATVAVVKETVVRSGEVLVSAKEDLSDHKRWLKAQTAAVQADRDRHERWLQRQHERQEALERRDRKRAKRRAARQAAMLAVKDATSRWVFAVRSAIGSVIGKILTALNFVFGSIAGGIAGLWRKLGDGVLFVARSVRRGVLFAVDAARAFAASIARLLSSSGTAATVKFNAVAPSANNFLSVAFGGVAARTREVSRAAGKGFAAVFARLSDGASAITQKAGEALEPAWRTVSQRAYALTPALWDRAAQARGHVGDFAQAGTARIQGFLPGAKATPVEGENALSLPVRVRGFELSQMLIIAGVLLLVLGGLMLGGGLLLRAGTPSSSTIEAASPAEPIAWLFDHKTFPLAERSLFAYETTPAGVRIQGFSIGGVNMAEDPISSLEAVLKPDLHSEELKLDLVVETPGDIAGGEPPAEADTAAVPPGTIPSQAPFKLVFLFSAPEAPQDVLKAAGGLLLKVRYEIAGKEKSFIQYLPADLLEEQLAEIQAEAAKGS